MDGVLCDFDEQCRRLFKNDMLHEETSAVYKSRIGSNQFWKQLRATQGEFWRTMPPMRSDIRTIVQMLGLSYEVTILTSPDRVDPYCIPAKTAWIKEHLGDSIPIIFEKEKYLHVKDRSDVLVDDYPKQIEQWIGAGGCGLLFKGDWDDVVLTLAFC